MIGRASGSGIGVGRLSRWLRGVGVIAMLDAGRDTTQQVESICEVPPSAGVLPLLILGVAVGVFIDCRCVADVVEVTR